MLTNVATLKDKIEDDLFPTLLLAMQQGAKIGMQEFVAYQVVDFICHCVSADETIDRKKALNRLIETVELYKKTDPEAQRMLLAGRLS